MSWADPFFIPLFFVISGYCTIYEINLWNKAIKLLIPYILFSLFLLIIYFHFEDIDILGVFYSRWSLYPLSELENVNFLRSGNGPLWFLTSMMVSYILFSFIRQSKRVLITCFLCMLVAYLFQYCPYLLPWSVDTSFIMVVFMLMGEEIRKFNLLNIVKPFFFLCLIIAYSLFMPFWGDINFSVRSYGNSFLLTTFLAIIGSFVLLRLSMIICKYRLFHPLSLIGEHSLTIFCLQFPVLGAWGKLLSYTGIEFPPIMKGVLIVLLTLISMYPLSLYVDRYILSKIYKRLIKHRKSN